MPSRQRRVTTAALWPHLQVRSVSVRAEDANTLFSFTPVVLWFEVYVFCLDNGWGGGGGFHNDYNDDDDMYITP